MEFIIFILTICIFILFNNFFSLKKESNFIKSIIEKYSEETATLKRELDELKKSIEGKTIASEPVISPIEEAKSPEIETIVPPMTEVIEEYKPYFTPIPDEDMPKEVPLTEEIPQIDNSFLSITPEEQKEEPIISYESQSVPRAEKQVVFEEKVYEESAFSKFMKSAEKQFADNWTGILGTAIMVLGIGYLSIYTALKVSPLFRVLILWLYAGLLVGAYYFLQKKEKWTTTGLWLRSAGASLFLFGCFGASQIPALTFISNSIAAYSLIAVGIGLNLFIGYIIKKQTFLSLHVILSMLILCVIPDKTLATFILAAITATIGILLSYKEKWEYHLLIVISAFIIFDIWFNAQGTKLSATENIIAILGIILVAASCMIMQYRNIYENTRFDKAGFITHLTNWILFATGLILHSTGSRFKTFVLFTGAIICFFIALKARKKKVFWLYHLDGMVSFVLLSLSIIMLNDWNVGIDIIACILYLLVVICLFVVFKEKEVLLHKIFLGINHITALALLIFSIVMISNSLNETKITSALISTITLSIIAVSVPIYTSIKKQFESIDAFFGDNNLSLNGLLAIVFSALVVIKSNDVLTHNLFVCVLIVLGLIWLLLRQKFENNTFDIGRIIFYVLSIFVGIFMIKIQDKSSFDFVFGTGLLILIAFNWKVENFYKNNFIIRFIGIIGVNALLLILVYKYLPHYQIIQIFSLFGIALLNNEFLWLNFKKNNLTTDNQTVLYLCYYFFAIAGSLLLLWRLSVLTNTEIGLTCMGISVIELYVLFANRIRNESEEITTDWKNFNFLNSELLLVNALLFGFSCLDIEYTTVFLSVLALLFGFGFQKFGEFKRYNNYSFILMIGCFVLSVFLAVDRSILDDKTLLYITQTASIIISFGYYYLLFKSEKEETKIYLKVLPYVQNLWVILLLFIQVELTYLPLLFMLLALLNYWLITKNAIKIEIHFTPVIALLAIIVSVLYSFNKLNNFDGLDWVLQLGSVGLGVVLSILLNKKEENQSLKTYYQIILNAWLSIIMFTQLEHKWLPVFWAITAILNLFLYHKKISQEKNISIVYYLLANLHLGFLSFNYYESKYLAIYLLIFGLLASYIYLASKWIEEFKLKNSLLIYPATLSIGCFLYFTFDKGILTFFWILEALGLLILGIILKEKYFRYVSLSLVGICIIRLMFFDLSNADFLIRALVLLGVGVVLLVMNSLFKKYKDRFD
ncbi:hypothetical protein [Flavobacterium sp.]|uniref:hypothetical protein n=1 Tax=Flavobacterium sp. TaxID=239 RepID=UPI00262D4A3C|nr:hypothetical protein [Flavobacterium sp.]